VPSGPLPPRDEAELFARARDLAGLSLGDLATRHGRVAPEDLRRKKGFVGELVERVLGGTRGPRPGPDFPELGIELKTLPVDAEGRPVESTFVCTLSLRDVGDLEWADSPVRKKLARVLFVPVEGERSRRVAERRVGSPLIWSPSARDEADLKFDWDELSGRVGRGAVESVTGHLGRFLQVRPKARDGSARSRAYDSEGAAFATLPRGFYLRASFTERIVREHYALGR
jgi:DNA mismatch repair protein MutH